jgi:hypothetical protein
MSSLAQNHIGNIAELSQLPVIEMNEVKRHTESTKSFICHLLKCELALAAIYCQFFVKKSKP